MSTLTSRYTLFYSTSFKMQSNQNYLFCTHLHDTFVLVSRIPFISIISTFPEKHFYADILRKKEKLFYLASAMKVSIFCLKFNSFLIYIFILLLLIKVAFPVPVFNLGSYKNAKRKNALYIS